MRLSRAYQIHRNDIRRIIEANHATNARVFSSVAAREDSEDSDLDILVDPLPETK